jgi:hypothetical protein
MIEANVVTDSDVLLLEHQDKTGLAVLMFSRTDSSLGAEK